VLQVLPGGTSLSGFFVSDFTMAEIELLAVRQPYAFRDHTKDGQYRREASCTNSPLFALSGVSELTTPAKQGRAAESKELL
jgi:hypothetical protein